MRKKCAKIRKLLAHANSSRNVYWTRQTRLLLGRRTNRSNWKIILHLKDLIYSDYLCGENLRSPISVKNWWFTKMA